MQFRQINSLHVSFIIAGVSKYGFLTGKDILLEKELLEKATTIKRF